MPSDESIPHQEAGIPLPPDQASSRYASRFDSAIRSLNKAMTLVELGEADAAVEPAREGRKLLAAAARMRLEHHAVIAGRDAKEDSWWADAERDVAVLEGERPDGPVMATRIANHCIAIYYPSLPPLPED